MSASASVPVLRMLGEGPARCEFCLGAHAFELEVLCATCDRAMCLLCALWTRSRHCCCPGCHAGQRSGEKGDD